MLFRSVLMLVDSHAGLLDKDKEILEQVKDKRVIFIFNKADLENNITQEMLEAYFSQGQVIKVSAKEQSGLNELRQAMKNFVVKGNTAIQNDATISNQRQKQSLINAIKSLEKVIDAIELGLPEDCLAIDLHDAFGHLGMIVGESLKEEIINQLFSRFCLGK